MSDVCKKLAAAKAAAEQVGNSTLVAMIDSAMHEAGCHRADGPQTNDSGPRGPVPPPPPPPPGPPSEGGSGS